MSEIYNAANQLTLERPTEEDMPSYEVRSAQPNCSFATIGRAACITCAAAPDCPLLKLRQARTEQTPDPERTTYLDSLLDDTSDDLVIAGYRAEEEDTPAELSSIPSLTLPDYSPETRNQSQQPTEDTHQTLTQKPQKPHSSSLLNLLQQAEVLAQPQTTNRTTIRQPKPQQEQTPPPVPPPSHKMATIRQADIAIDTKPTPTVYKQPVSIPDTPPAQVTHYTLAHPKVNKPKLTIAPHQSIRKKSTTQEKPAQPLNTPIQHLHRPPHRAHKQYTTHQPKAVPLQQQPNPNLILHKRVENAPSNRVTKEVKTPVYITHPQATMRPQAPQKRRTQSRTPSPETSQPIRQHSRAKLTPPAFNHKNPDTPTANLKQTAFLPRPKQLLDFFSRITELSTAVPLNHTIATNHNKVRTPPHNTLSTQTKSTHTQETYRIPQRQHEQGLAITAVPRPLRKAQKIPAQQPLRAYRRHKPLYKDKGTARTHTATPSSLSHYPEQFARTNRPANFSLHTAIEAFATGVQRILQSLFA